MELGGGTVFLILFFATLFGNIASAVAWDIIQLVVCGGDDGDDDSSTG